MAEYRELQAKQSRYEQVRELLGKFKTDRVKELDTAYQAYKSAIADVGERVAAGISIRNLHEHFKGDLYEKARIQRRENMTWERMAIRLARGGEGSAEHTELLNQNHNWESLQTRLTEVAKGQKSGIVADLDDIWTKFLDYMFIVLGLIVVEN
ncbi:MAG: hypothetical protein KF828_02125 [Anaerolineales bacterium]|nr:hypothetical protein [Anaerolineales bacterium]